jgi:hypothetical protein
VVNAPTDAKAAGRHAMLAGAIVLLIASGIGMIAVHAWGADMFGLSVIVACASLASAIVCLLAAWLGLIWPAPLHADQDREARFLI